MLALRALGALKKLSRVPNNKNLQNKSQVRFGSHGSSDPHGGWKYREPCVPEKWSTRGATACAVFVYWWIYWNLWHGYPHLIGLYDGHFLPNPREYTDEELGIPPDEEGL